MTKKKCYEGLRHTHFYTQCLLCRSFSNCHCEQEVVQKTECGVVCATSVHHSLTQPTSAGEHCHACDCQTTTTSFTCAHTASRTQDCSTVQWLWAAPLFQSHRHPLTQQINLKRDIFKYDYFANLQTRIFFIAVVGTF